MLTTAITAAIYAVLKMLGFEPNAATMAGIWVAVKVLIVGGILGLTAKFMKKRADAAKAKEGEQAP